MLVSGIAHGLAAMWAMNAFPSLARRRKAVRLAVVVLALLPGVLRLVARSRGSELAVTVFAAAMIEVCTVVIAVMPVTIVGVVLRAIEGARARKADAARAAAVGPARAGVGARADAAADADADAVADADADADADAVADANANADAGADDDARIGRRRLLEQVAGVSVFAGTGLALGWGAVRGRHAFAMEEVVVRVAGWPRALEGYTIAQISDIHVGAFIGDRELDEGFEVVRRAKPDLVVATGDLVDFRAEVVGPLALRLASVPARDGAAAILGNHDHYAGAEEVLSLMQAGGVRVLSNQSARLRTGDGAGFALVGVDDLQGRTRPSPGFAGPDLARALAPLPPDLPKILLAHQPRYFVEAAGRVALQLSGHTHGGQINPGFRPADLVMTFVSGRYERSGSTLWVNRGFGVAGPPSRVGAPPEVTKVVIVAA